MRAAARGAAEVDVTPPAATLQRHVSIRRAEDSAWVVRTLLLWRNRRLLARVTGIALLLSLAIAFSIPKQYKSTTSISPPDQQHSNAMMLAALAARSGSLGALGSIAGGLIGGHSTSDFLIDLLRSGTVSGHLIDHFDLQHVYRKKYRMDAAKHLAHSTKITENKKSGVIKIEVVDTDRVRARDIAQGYLNELNRIVFRTNNSSAHLERVFIENRLKGVQADLEQAQLKLSDFSAKNTAVDIREQTRALVDAGARVQAQLLAEQASLQSLRQIYGDANVRVRESEARIASLRGDLAKMAGSSAKPAEQDEGSTATNAAELYPPLRQLPRLGVAYADLYRRVRVQETLYEFLTQQYEMARIEEAKDLPAITVIDAPGIAEKKSFPPRLWVTLGLTFLTFAVLSTWILLRDGWSRIESDDPRKELAAEIVPVFERRLRWISTMTRRRT
ncbi:MAG TPA: Wzz/FepE/Etk N-terminal domain-containing protein [Terracidiphilus sp.]|nr:Wzz/FepE/Etk N-terminal domain-containing protein [Terracidiphilus sp.]